MRTLSPYVPLLTPLMAVLMAASAGQCATAAGPKFCNVILHNQGETSIVGLHRFVDAAKERGIWDRMKLTIVLSSWEPTVQPEERDFLRELVDEGHQFGVELLDRRDVVAEWLGIQPEAITFTAAQLFGDADVERQAAYVQQGFRASANVCVEGNSLAEFWDIPHNWEGAPMFPYWAQWDAERPAATARTNRELDKTEATLELHWATRTLWHNYDRFPIPQCFHFGEPLKNKAWRVGQLQRRGDGGGWWRAELAEYERNLEAGRTPFLYISTASEANVFTPEGPWGAWLDEDEALACAIDLLAHMLDNGWILCTVDEFTNWFAERWPCPAAPSMVYLMNDTLANRTDLDGRIILGHGRLLHAETKHYQICDHENRMAPEMVIAYDLRAPNLLRSGDTFANPEKWNTDESRDGHYGSTTGNALFWSPTPPLADVGGVPYFAPSKPVECRDRTFTVYLGERWEDYQFVPGEVFDVRREGDIIRWSKRMRNPAAGTADVRLHYHHELKGPVHRVTVEIEGDAAGQPVRLRLSPYFHQGWDQPLNTPVTDPRILNPATAGQEHNVFGRVADRELAYSESNAEQNELSAELPAGGALHLFLRNPGTTELYCDNPDLNRGVSVTLSRAARVTLIDAPGPGKCVTAVADFGPHTPGATYGFSFSYWHGELGD